MPVRSTRLFQLSWLVVSVGLILIAGHGNVACEGAFEQPCRLTKEEVLLEDPTIGTLPALALSRSKGRATALWVRRELPDAGAAGAGMDANADAATDGGVPFPVIASFDVAVIDERGALALATKVPTPDALRKRRDSLEGMGIVVEDGDGGGGGGGANSAFLIHWIETVTTTDPDGRLRQAASLRLAYAGAAEPIATLPPRAACEHCVVALASVSVGSESIIILQIDPDVIDVGVGVGVLSAAPPQPSFVAFRSRRGGSVVDAPIPWLALPPPPPITDGGGQLGTIRPATERGNLDAFVDGEGRIVITSSGYAWLADASLNLLHGPIILPAARDPHVSWDRASVGGAASEASIAWSITPYEDGRSANAAVPGEIFVGFVPPNAGAIATRERASRGRVLLAIDRRAEDVGLLFESAGRTLFASVDSRGKKRGGDVLVSTPSSLESAGAGSQSEYGLPAIGEATLVFAREDHRFGVITLGAGKLIASEITCAR